MARVAEPAERREPASPTICKRYPASATRATRAAAGHPLSFSSIYRGRPGLPRGGSSLSAYTACSWPWLQPLSAPRRDATRRSDACCALCRCEAGQAGPNEALPGPRPGSRPGPCPAPGAPAADLSPRYTFLFHPSQPSSSPPHPVGLDAAVHSVRCCAVARRGGGASLGLSTAAAARGGAARPGPQ